MLMKSRVTGKRCRQMEWEKKFETISDGDLKNLFPTLKLLKSRFDGEPVSLDYFFYKLKCKTLKQSLRPGDDLKCAILLVSF